jgi:cupin fold WbuC family metalloprotein
VSDAPLFFGAECFEQLTAAAQASVRRRKNLDFHAFASHPAQRLLNAVEPNSYIRPHRHLDLSKDETFVVLRGALGLVLFDEDGNVTASRLLRPEGDMVGAHVPARTFHCLVSLARGSVFFEAKAGPYDAATDKDWPSWAPSEGAPEASAYLERLRSLFEQHR